MEVNIARVFVPEGPKEARSRHATSPLRVGTLAVAAALVAVFIASPQRNACTADTWRNAAMRPLLHASWEHLALNVVLLFILRDVENARGTLVYLAGVAIMYAFIVVVDRVTPASTDGCPVGFTSIVLGLAVWSGFTRGKYALNVPTLVALVFLLVSPLIRNTAISFWGNLYGIMAGLIVVALTALLTRRLSTD
jgi:membrane associated rhomboid family serine protease